MEEIKKNFKQCEICKIEATSLCSECVSYFCDACYKYVHDKKENSSHKKQKIDYFVPIDTKCPDHPKNIIDLFCIDEQGKIYILILLNFYYRSLLCFLLFS